MPSMAKAMMSSFKVGELPLSERLSSLKLYYTNEEHIWDIGCDHGNLGLSFVNNKIKTINLVDPSRPVVDSLLKKTKDAYITNNALSILLKKGQDLIITQPSNLIFIAGMGGKEIGEIVLNLLPQLDFTSKIVISPHRKILELRALLNTLPISLIHEKVLLEDGQFYQILCLSPVVGEKVTPYGDNLWSTEVGKNYLEHQLEHFSCHHERASQLYVDFLKTYKSLKLTL